MRVLVTGANGFLGKNLIVRLKELGVATEVYTRNNSIEELPVLIGKVDYIFHLAGENRPLDNKHFDVVNKDLTLSICKVVKSLEKKIPIIFASSSQAVLKNAYGKSKLDAEIILEELHRISGCPIYIYRFPGIFGKWCKPNYNSVVATFCFNISHNLPIKVNDSSFEITLVYVDDVVEELVSIIEHNKSSRSKLTVLPEYKITLGELSEQINFFHNSRNSLISERVGGGLIRKLYSTYVSYFSPEQFSYSIPAYSDERGIFAEFMKTKDSGQFSFFTAGPGFTRGGHYHHSKTEKFLVLHGDARFRFKQIITNENFELKTSGNDLKVVETVPGWSHDITNIGKKDMIVMLWANEIFDPNNPDTIAYQL